MKVSIGRSSNDLRLTFVPDEQDGVPPISEVWFAGSLLKPLSSERLCIFSYLLAAPFVGNTLEFDGVSCPAHIAARISAMAATNEFFLAPVDNRAKRIHFESKHACLSLTSNELNADLVLRRHPLGYEISPMPEPDGAKLIRSNIDLFAGLAKASALLPRLVLFVAISEAVGVRQALCRGAEPAMIARLRPLFADAGLELQE